MPAPVVIIISGPPCTGKTTLGQRLAGDLHLPFISKDRIKELLFDTLGVGDRAWSQKLGAASMAMLYMLVDTELAAGRSFILEANFRPAQANAQFRTLKEKHNFQVFLVECSADTEVLLARFKARTESGERHAGHIDHIVYPEIAKDLINGVYGPLEIADTVYMIDSTDFENIGYERLLERLKGALSAL